MHKENAFFLIEIIICLSVFILVFSAISNLNITSINATNRSIIQYKALLINQNKAEELLLLDKDSLMQKIKSQKYENFITSCNIINQTNEADLIRIKTEFLTRGKTGFVSFDFLKVY